MSFGQKKPEKHYKSFSSNENVEEGTETGGQESCLSETKQM